MEDFILGLLWSLLEPVLDGLIEYVFAGVADFLFRAVREVFNTKEIEHPALAVFGHLLFGFLMGGLSLILFPRRIVHRSTIPGLSLLISPLIVGLLMSATRSILQRRDKTVIQIESFGYGCAFGLGMALVRFWFAK